MCRSSSCAEWCLSKGGSSCRHIYVSVRQNGTDVEWENCTAFTNTTCPRFEQTPGHGINCGRDLDQVRQIFLRRCQIFIYSAGAGVQVPLCSGLSGLFLCELGTCWNITAAFSCSWRGEDTEPPLNCYYKRNCIELAGMYSCQAGHCTK